MFTTVIYRRISIAASLVLILAACFDTEIRERIKQNIERFQSCPGSHSQLVVAPDSKTFITANDLTAKTAVIQWDRVSGRKLQEFDVHLSASGDFQPVPPSINVPLAITADGKTLAGVISMISLKNRFTLQPITEHFIAIWDVATGETSQVWKENFEESDDFIRFLAFDPNGKILLTQTRSGVIKLRHLSNGQLIKRIDSKAEQRFPVVISPDRDFFATMHDDGTVKFWEIVSGRQLGSLKAHPSHTPLAISIDGKTLLIQNAGDVKRFREISTGAELVTLHGSLIEFPFATTIDGEYVLIKTGQSVNLYDMKKGLIIRAFEEISPHTYIYQLLVSPDRKTFVSVEPGGNYKLWDLETGKKLFTLVEGWERGTNVYTPDSKTLINIPWSSNYVTTWDLSNGSLVHKFCINNFVTELSK
ncbi:MAG: hypothetical protein QNJ72_36250 [Pleurocapsa sp. MO_226.B13]|nr:hypothetical protein [Pleurocapsa sp. MO_226.B13]